MVTGSPRTIASVTTTFQKEYVAKKYGIPEPKISVVPNCIDTEHFAPERSATKKTGRVVFVGRLNPEKNLANLLMAFQDSPYTLDLYFGESAVEKDWRIFASMNRCNVSFMGRVSNADLPQILNQYDLFALVSHKENNPKALLEAMSCGIGVLGSRVPGIENVIQDGVNGRLVSTDADDIKKGIDRLMASPHDLAKMGVSARQTVIERFSLQKVGQLEREIYESPFREKRRAVASA